MTREELMADGKFRNKCHQYGLDWEEFWILDDIIVVSSPKENTYVLFDEKYNVIGICDNYKFKIDSEYTKKVFEGAKSIYDNVSESIYLRLPYPFNKLSLKEIVELSNRFYIHETNHGHSYDAFVNEQLVDGEQDSVYVALLAYIQIIASQIEEYFRNLYRMKVMGLQYPDIYSYLKSFVASIDECIVNYINKGKKPDPMDVIAYLGLDIDKIEEYYHFLNLVIDLLMKDKVDLSIYAKRLLKLLEVPQDELDSRYKKRIDTLKMEKVSLDDWLSDYDSKNHRFCKK